jgi:hypothetical protein
VTGPQAAMPPYAPAGDEKLPDLSSVVLRLEDSPTYEFDLTRLAGPIAMRIEIGAAILAWSAETGGIRTAATLHSVRRSVSAWMRWVQSWNENNPNALVAEIRDVGAFHIVRYRTHLSDRYTSNTARGYLIDLRSVLRRAHGTPAGTMRATISATPRSDARSVQRYTPNEFSAIRNAARRVVEKAHERIHPAHLEALTEQGPVELQTIRGRALYELLTLGAPQSMGGFAALGTLHPVTRKPNLRATRHILFLDAQEAFAAAVLIACHRGLNLSSVLNAASPVLQGDDFWQLEMDKPRRGSKRFWPEFIDGISDPKSARAIRLVVEATEPARTLLAEQRTPTTTLLLRWSGEAIKEGIPQIHTRRNASWVPDGANVNFSRLRRSVPGSGVIKEPTDHDPATYLKYVKSDPVALQERQILAVAGIEAAMDTARQRLHMAIRENADLAESNDALIVNCSDPAHHPETHAPCTKAFYSFLDCLDCGNAATVARLIPRQLAAVSVLDQLRDALGGAWEKRFARRYYQLNAMLERHTPTELEVASSSMSRYIPTILSALRLEVPR